MDRHLDANKWSLLYLTGFALFVVAVITGSGWFIPPATIFVLVAALGRPLSAVTWPGGSVKWQNEAIGEIGRITYEEAVDPQVRQAMEEAQREAVERGEGMGATSAGEYFQRLVTPSEFARAAVTDVTRTLRNADEFARSRGLRK